MQCTHCGAPLKAGTAACAACGEITPAAQRGSASLFGGEARGEVSEGAGGLHSSLPEKEPAAYEAAPRFSEEQHMLEWRPPERPFAEGETPPPLADHPEAASLSAVECLRMLLLGLLPGIGLVANLLWAFGDAVATQRRNLALAMLYLHAAVLAVVLLGLLLWVGRLFLMRPA